MPRISYGSIAAPWYVRRLRGEHAELQQLVLERQAAARAPAARDVDLDAGADARPLAHGCRHSGFEERVRGRRNAHRSRLERVERVSLDEPAMQPGPDVRAADHIQHHAA